MKIISVTSNKISLPAEAFRRLGGKEVEVIETREGVLLRPVENIIKSTRGFLKGKGSFSSKKFMSRKKEERELE